MSFDGSNSASSAEVSAFAPASKGGVETFAFDRLPQLRRAQIAVEHRLRRLDPGALLKLVPKLSENDAHFGTAEVLWRPSGINRTAIVVQFVWPRLATRLGIGLELPVGHLLVDRLLDASRPPEELRLPISPVEWGILTFLLSEIVGKLRGSEGPLGPWDLLIDRAGPDPIDLEGLGEWISIRWPLRLGVQESSVRLWITDSLLRRWLDQIPHAGWNDPGPSTLENAHKLEAEWRAEAGEIVVARGLKALKARALLPLTGDYRRGTVDSPQGLVRLICRTSEMAAQHFFLAEAAPEGKGGRITLMSVFQSRKAAPESLKPSLRIPPNEPTGVVNMDAPVTLIVELGRVNLTLSKLADLKTGDVIELRRHSREPIELTSGGRTVARGELVQIDDELGVRITHVLL